MDLFLVRHAAAAAGPLYGDDGERPLTADGRRSAQEVGAALARQGVKLDVIVASPLVRAVETAELLAVTLGYAGELQILPELTPEGSPQAIIERAIRTQGANQRVALVGHLPSMGNVVGALLGRSGVSLSKMAVVRLALPEGENDVRAKLVWVITPRRLDPVASLDAL